MKKLEWSSCLGILVGTIAISIVHVILNAWALSILWGWFISPFGLPRLTIAKAAGISVVFNLLIRGAINTDEDINWHKAIAKAVISPIISVGIGWIILQFT